jgi:putative MATE family efflux protein
MVIQWLFGKEFLFLFGASDITLVYAWNYLKIYAAGSVFVLISVGLNAFITAQGFTKISMISVIIGGVTNIILDAVFILGFNMGVQGAALATVIAQLFSSIWIICFLRGKKTTLRIRKKHLKIEKKTYLPCVALGLSPFVMNSTEGLITICFNTSLLQYGGDIAVGAMTILASVMQLSMLPLTGITQGAQPIISFNYGAGNIKRVKKTFFLTFRACMLFGAVIWGLSIFTPDLLIGIFTSDSVLTEYTEKAIRIYMATAFLLAVQVSCQQTFLALGKAKISLFLAALRKIFLLIPLIYIIPCFVNQKDLGVFLAEPIADTLAVIATASCFIYIFKKILKQQL